MLTRVYVVRLPFFFVDLQLQKRVSFPVMQYRALCYSGRLIVVVGVHIRNHLFVLLVRNLIYLHFVSQQSNSSILRIFDFFQPLRRATKIRSSDE